MNTVYFSNIPADLTCKPNWVAWGVPWEELKAPFKPEALLHFQAVPAKAGAPATWGTFEAAQKCVSMGLAKGIGYEFDGSGVYGIDLDHVISDGVVTQEARRIVRQLASYTEISPSGTGLHIFVTAPGVNITRHRKKGGFIEIYSAQRYFTVTGDVCGDYRAIQARPNVLQMLHDKYLLPIPDKAPAPSIPSANVTRSSDDTLQRGLMKDHVLRACWNGERRYGDESGSDQALMNKLAYWLNADQPAMIAAFLQSPYYGQKDEAHKRKCQRVDYLPNTAKSACAVLRSTEHEDTQRRQRQARAIIR